MKRIRSKYLWDKQTQTIVATTDEKVIKLVIDNKTAKINGKDNILPAPPKIII